MYFMDATPGITALQAPIHEWAEISPGAAAPPPPYHDMASHRTSFTYYKSTEFEVFARDETRVTGSTKYAPSTHATATTRTAGASDRSADRVESIASQRVKLLAASYVSSPTSREVLARLAILDEQMLEESPPVTPSQVAALEKVADRLAVLQSRRQERNRRLGLTV